MGEPTWQEITAEAIRRKAQALEDGRGDIELEALIVEITREGWKPPPAVDPDVLAYREWAVGSAPNQAWREEVLAGKWDRSVTALGFVAGARFVRQQAHDQETVLQWLNSQINLELSWCDEGDGDGEWRVCRVVGGDGPRPEWHLVGAGETPLSALMDARAALARDEEGGR